MDVLEYQALEDIARDKPWMASKLLKEYLRTVTPTEEKVSEGQIEANKGTWTGNQRNASWLYITQKVDQLNLAGLDMRVVLKPTYNITWTKENFHDHVWIPIQKALFGTESMRDLQKDQPGRIHQLIEREIGEKHGLEYIDFPHFNMKMEAMENMKKEDYPDYNGEPKF